MFSEFFLKQFSKADMYLDHIILYSFFLQIIISEGYFKKHNNLEHSVDSAEKKLGREKEEKWKIDMINKF